jgi:hypothetical protein
MSKLSLLSTTIARYWLVIFLLASIAFASTYLITQLSIIEFDLNINLVIWAFFLQLIVSLVISISWHHNLKLNDIKGLTFLNSLLLSGVASIGKYWPGKVLGSLVRGIILARKNQQKESIIIATLIEQLAMLHTGGAILIISYLNNHMFSWLLFATFVLGLSFFLVEPISRRICHLDKIGQLPWVKVDVSLCIIKTKPYLIISFYLLVIWLLSAGVLKVLLLEFSSITYMDCLFYMTLAYISGFIAFISPGGLGVRDAVLATLLSPLVGVPVSLVISAIHRSITLFIDLIWGGGALMFFRYSERKNDE